MNQTKAMLPGTLFAAVFGVLSFAAPAAAQIALDDPRLKADRFEIEYVPPKDPKHIPLYDTLRREQLLEKMKEFLSPFRLPVAVKMKVEGCNGVMNATFERDTISVCYEYFDLLMRYAPRMTRAGLTPRDALIGPTVEVFLHEWGHGILRVLDVPFFGKEEDAADYIATYLLLKFAKNDARRLILGSSFVADNEVMEEQKKMNVPDAYSLADAHSLPAQRYFNRWCLAYGMDQELFADAIELGMLPTGRVKWCRWEWSTNEDAWKRLVEPYIDQDLKKKVQARQWFTFESSVAATMAQPPRVATDAGTTGPKPASR
jgi:hypothetical protein